MKMFNETRKKQSSGDRFVEVSKFTIFDPKRLRVKRDHLCLLWEIAQLLIVHLGCTVKREFEMTQLYGRDCQ